MTLDEATDLAYQHRDTGDYDVVMVLPNPNSIAFRPDFRREWVCRHKKLRLESDEVYCAWLVPYHIGCRIAEARNRLAKE